MSADVGVLAAVTVDAGRTELRRFPLPDSLDGGALLRVEAAGVCGSDVGAYQRTGLPPRIMGHENIGTIEAIDGSAARAWGVGVGDRVLIEEYLPCGQCGACRSGNHRYCPETDVAAAAPLRFGTTPIDVAPSLWGGYSEVQYLHRNTMVHRVPERVSSILATLALPIANGVQFLQYEAGIQAGDRVFILGPGQQGLGAAIAALDAGAEVVVAGRETDTRRLEAAKSLGAETVIVDTDYEGEADFVLDMAAGSAETVDIAMRALRPGGTLLLGASKPVGGGDISVRTLSRMHARVLGVRGHTYAAVERALEVLAAGRYPFDQLCTHHFSLSEVDRALRPEGDVIHSCVIPNG